jgi:uncharacterized protein
MSGRLPEHTIERPWLVQDWRAVTFLHWRVDPSEIAPLLPPDLEPDIVDGSAWLAITPFRVTRATSPTITRRTVVPPFAETNLRTYVRHRSGRNGLWFISIDVSSKVSFAGGRLLAAPYHLADASISVGGTTSGQRVTYRCERSGRSPASHDIVMEPGEPTGSDEVIASLTGRWSAFTRVGSRRRGVTFEIPVTHQPWPLYTARVVELEQSLMAAAGLRSPSGAAVAHWSDGVTACFGRPRPA